MNPNTTRRKSIATAFTAALAALFGASKVKAEPVKPIASTEADVLRQIRTWLKDGAIISATDATRPVLEFSKDGKHFIGGMTIDFGKAKRTP
jgi:hypothetical protein